MDNAQTKTQLLDSLSAEQRYILVRWLASVARPKIPDSSNRKYLDSIEAATLFSLLHKKLFGEYRCDGAVAATVLGHLDQVKQMLQAEIPNHTFPTDSLGCPILPDGLLVHNASVRNVAVSLHAWRRFCQRFCSKKNPATVARLLQAEFDNSVMLSLETRPELIRLINNKGVPAEYFFDPSQGCRFVVVQKDDKHILTTVERPRS